MLTAQQIADAVATLHGAELESRQVPALTLTYPGMDLEDAYAVQQGWVARKLAEGRRVIGYKIGLTSKAMQEMANSTEPDYSAMLDAGVDGMRFAWTDDYGFTEMYAQEESARVIPERGRRARGGRSRRFLDMIVGGAAAPRSFGMAGPAPARASRWHGQPGAGKAKLPR